MQKNYLSILLLAMTVSFSANAQQSELKPLPLDDLSAFRAQAGNWRIVGDVTMNPAVDTHPQEEVVTKEPVKRGKKSKSAPIKEKPQAVTFADGKGILLNLNDDTKKDQLVSILEHGDLELELEVMLPKGSNSGIYLQGRYEVQLFDSWGAKVAKYSDIGGIYRNWENEPSKIYMGKAPLANAAKAPGLWQKMKISFRAPRFDTNGKKIANAKFAKVELNGLVIHENVEVPLPTGGPIQNNEVATGPLMIQGDHGPVAFRNIRYGQMKENQYKLSDISYQIYHGNFKSTNDFKTLKPVLTGTSKELGSDVVDVENAYGIHYKGEVTVPEDARYKFNLIYTGGTKFIFNNKEMFNFPTPDAWRVDTASMFLKEGTYPFEILNFKDASWMPPRLAFFIGTADSYPKPLHSTNSYPPPDNPTASIFIEPGKSPRLVRAFIDFKGSQKDRLTHTIGVGDPSGLHYVYDLKSGNLVCVWKGGFIDATPMWHDRGDGSFKPLGSALFLFNNQPLAYLNSQNDAFPAAAKEGDLVGHGYAIEESSNRPVFRFSYQGLEFEDHVYPDENNQVISHEVVFKKGSRKEGLYYKLAEGSSIQEMPDGSYAINDKEYYVKVGLGPKPFIRDVNGKKELVATFSQQSIKYSIIW